MPYSRYTIYCALFNFWLSLFNANFCSQSGTTGMAKGVALSHRNIISNAMQMSSDLGHGLMLSPAEGNHQDILPCVLPFFHIYGLTCTLLSKMALGCKLITLPRFTPDTFLNVLENHDSTLVHLAPPLGESHFHTAQWTWSFAYRIPTSYVVYSYIYEQLWQGHFETHKSNKVCDVGSSTIGR